MTYPQKYGNGPNDLNAEFIAQTYTPIILGWAMALMDKALEIWSIDLQSLNEGRYLKKNIQSSNGLSDSDSKVSFYNR